MVTVLKTSSLLKLQTLAPAVTNQSFNWSASFIYSFFFYFLACKARINRLQVDNLGVKAAESAVATKTYAVLLILSN